jgi:putative ABC transport system permease protein
MHRGLQGFVYHIDLEPAAFACAGLLALAIAIATVGGHALRFARLKPTYAHSTMVSIAACS